MKRTNELRSFWSQPDLGESKVKVAGYNPPKEFWTDECQMQLVKDNISYLNAPSGGVIMDFGCGIGRISRQLLRLGYQVRAVDVAPDMLKHAQNYCREFGNKITYHLSDGYGCGDIADLSVDGVLSFATFQHMLTLDMVESILCDMYRMLKANGTVHLQFVNGGVDEAHAQGYDGIAQSPSIIGKILEKLKLDFKIVKYAPLFGIDLSGWFGVVGRKLLE